MVVQTRKGSVASRVNVSSKDKKKHRDEEKEHDLMGTG